MSDALATKGVSRGRSTSIEFIDSLAITDKSSDYVWPDAECPSSFQPAKSLRFSFAARSRPALQVNPEHAPFNYLKINMPSAYICMVENHISPQVATDYCKWLI